MVDLANARILVVNDDGIAAPGLKVMEKIARSLGKEVWVVAPHTEQSGASHAFTVTSSIRVEKLGRRRFAVSGSPTDCVLLGVGEIMAGAPPDLILSGVNKGANLAEEVIYSGTVAGAMEGALLGFRSIALSQTTGPGRTIDWSASRHYGEDIIRRLLSVEWTRDVFMNVNFPACRVKDVKDTVVVPQGRRSGGYEIHDMPMRGRQYYMIGEPQHNNRRKRGDADFRAIDRNDIAITPLHVDLTHRGSLTTIRSLFATTAPER